MTIASLSLALVVGVFALMPCSHNTAELMTNDSTHQAVATPGAVVLIFGGEFSLNG